MIHLKMRVFLIVIVMIVPINCLAQDVAKAGSKYTLLELRAAASKSDSFDSGLTAELLTARWLVEHGLKTNDAIDYFMASVSSRTACEVPGWWKNRFTHEFVNANVELSDYSAQDSASFGSIKLKIIKFGDRLLRLPEGFIPHQDIFGGVVGDRQFLVCASGTGKLSDLVAGFVEDSGKKQPEAFKSFVKIPLSEWCPILVDSVLDDSLEDKCRGGTVEFRESGNTLFIFGDAGNRLFIAAFDLVGNKRKFCFTVSESFEASCLGCSLEELQQSSMGGF